MKSFEQVEEKEVSLISSLFMQHQTAACGNLKAVALDFNFIPTYLTLPEALFALCADAHTHRDAHTPLHHHFTHDGMQPVNSPHGAVLSAAIISGCHP